jgi:hypothetical protein
MKTLLLLLSATVLLTAGASANAGAGPWANGAYFPGQLDGRYSANVYNNTQARFDTDQMDTPSGNRVRTDTFSTNAGTADTTTVESSLSTNVTSTVTISNDAGVITSSNAVITTNITTQFVTNTVPGINGSTNLDTSGAANVVSGVLGFGVRNGTPSTSAPGSSSAAGGTGGTGGAGGTPSGASGAGGSGGTVETIGLDSSHNYFVIYVNGDVFAGQTAAGINLNTKRVAGGLWNGIGGLKYQVVTNISVGTNTATLTNQVLAVPNATAGGYFNAKIKSDKSPFVFKGAGAITVNSAATVSSPSGTYPFDLDGIKSSDNSISGYSLTGRNAP